MPSRDWEQHFTVDLVATKALLDSIDLTGRCVLEIGTGRGALTKLILSRRPRLLHTFEVDPTIVPLREIAACCHPDTTLTFSGDVREAVLAGPHAPYFDCLIAFPPYKMLGEIAAFVRKARIKHVILMVPPRSVDLFPAFTVEAGLDGNAFDPPSDGRHLIIKRGF